MRLEVMAQNAKAGHSRIVSGERNKQLSRSQNNQQSKKVAAAPVLCSKEIRHTSKEKKTK
jgi:hypothetical protein